MEEACKHRHDPDEADVLTGVRSLQAALTIQILTFLPMSANFRLPTIALRKMGVEHGTQSSHTLVVEDLGIHEAAEQMADTSLFSQ